LPNCRRVGSKNALPSSQDSLARASRA